MSCRVYITLAESLSIVHTLIQQYLESIKSVCPEISEKALVLLSEKITAIELKPKMDFIKADMLQKSVGYVSTGLLRAFYINDEGAEITINFIEPHKLVVHLDALNAYKPSKFIFQALEPTIMLNIPRAHIDFCAEKYPILEKYLRVMIEEVYCLMFRRLDALLTLTAEERYLQFLKESPSWASKIKVTHLCSYLGSSRQSLTRIRNRHSHVKFDPFESK